MYSAGDHIVYGTQGVCRVTELTSMPLGNEMKDYYVLSPLSDPRSKIFVPVDNPALVSQMRKVLTRDEIECLLSSVSPDTDMWIESDRDRKEFCANTIRSGDRLALLNLIRMLCVHRDIMKDQKKHFHVTDERFLREAENLLHDEFSFVLGLSRSEVSSYINEKLEMTS